MFGFPLDLHNLPVWEHYWIIPGSLPFLVYVLFCYILFYSVSKRFCELWMEKGNVLYLSLHVNVSTKRCQFSTFQLKKNIYILEKVFLSFYYISGWPLKAHFFKTLLQENIQLPNFTSPNKNINLLSFHWNLQLLYIKCMSSQIQWLIKRLFIGCTLLWLLLLIFFSKSKVWKS